VSKKGIATKEGVIDADYPGEIMVIIINHGKVDCRIREGDLLVHLISERINTSYIMEVDKLELMERADSGFGSTDMSPKRKIPVRNAKRMICLLQGDLCNNEYFNIKDIGNHLRLRPRHVLISSVIISQVVM